MAIDAGPAKINPRVLVRKLLHARHLIGQSVVAQITKVGIMKFLRSPGGSHAIKLDDDESELSQRLRVSARRRKGAPADAAGLRTWIDVIHDGVFFRNIKIRR